MTSLVRSSLKKNLQNLPAGTLAGIISKLAVAAITCEMPEKQEMQEQFRLGSVSIYSEMELRIGYLLRVPEHFCKSRSLFGREYRKETG